MCVSVNRPLNAIVLGVILQLAPVIFDFYLLYDAHVDMKTRVLMINCQLRVSFNCPIVTILPVVWVF